MIRISFTKIQFSQNTSAQQTFVQIDSENSSTFKLKPKKIKNQLARFYGEFFELETNNMSLKFKVYILEPGNNLSLVEKISIRKNSYGLSQKKSHFVQTIKLKLWFDSQKIDNQNSKTQNSTNQSSGFSGNGILNDRMGLMKILREFSPDQKCSFQKQSSINALVSNESKNMTMRIFPKGTFKDLMTVGL